MPAFLFSVIPPLTLQIKLLLDKTRIAKSKIQIKCNTQKYVFLGKIEKSPKLRHWGFVCLFVSGFLCKYFKDPAKSVFIQIYFCNFSTNTGVATKMTENSKTEEKREKKKRLSISFSVSQDHRGWKTTVSAHISVHPDFL